MQAPQLKSAVLAGDHRMINSLLLVDDEDLFHLVFEDACSILDIALSIQTMYSTDEAERQFGKWKDNPHDKPEVAFIDLNIIGSSIDGIDLIQRVNTVYGNGVVIGMISSSSDQVEIDRAIQAGAQFWIVKSDDIEPRLEEFYKDYPKYAAGTATFRVYK